MKITWYGHAAFLIETQGLRIIIDPYRSPDCGGYLPIEERADIVAVSHENDRYHSHLGQILGPFEVVRGLEIPPGGVTHRGVTFEAIRVYESPEKRAEDEVSILHFRSEGLHVVHLGDLGHALTDPEAEQIRSADVLMVPAGGPPTIDYPLVHDLIEAISPRILIPMHFLTAKINLKIQPCERFLESLPSWPVDRRTGSTLEIKGDRRIVVLHHAR